MIFNSPEFIFGFLPALGLMLFLLRRLRVYNLIQPILLLFSIIFYSFAGFWASVLLIISIIINFQIAIKLNTKFPRGRTWLTAGVIFNLLYIFAFKYPLVTGKLFPNLNLASILPLGISFYSFVQIGYLFDVYEGYKPEKKIINYALFTSFFSSVSSGPIVQYEDLGEQLKGSFYNRIKIDKITRGFSLFLLGLFKKVIIADYLSSLANPVFSASASQVLLNSFEAWVGGVSYTLQIYFDFSGYSDMAVGIGWMIGINLPWNFNSPYKSVNIVDFWRRWHISLSSWLNNYILEPINYAILKNSLVKKSRINKTLYAYLVASFITMFICGLWHGATINFILWGVFNFLLIAINRCFHEARNSNKNSGKKIIFYFNISDSFARGITFISLTFAWVLFRATNLKSAIEIWRSMFGMNGVYIPVQIANKLHFDTNSNIFNIFHITSLTHELFIPSLLNILLILGFLLIVVFYFPNTKELMMNESNPSRNVISNRLLSFIGIRNGWSPNFTWAVITSICMIALFTWEKISGFIYFNF